MDSIPILLLGTEKSHGPLSGLDLLLHILSDPKFRMVGVFTRSLFVTDPCEILKVSKNKKANGKFCSLEQALHDSYCPGLVVLDVLPNYNPEEYETLLRQCSQWKLAFISCISRPPMMKSRATQLLGDLFKAIKTPFPTKVIHSIIAVYEANPYKSNDFAVARSAKDIEKQSLIKKLILEPRKLLFALNEKVIAAMSHLVGLGPIEIADYDLKCDGFGPYFNQFGAIQILISFKSDTVLAQIVECLVHFLIYPSQQITNSFIEEGGIEMMDSMDDYLSREMRSILITKGEYKRICTQCKSRESQQAEYLICSKCVRQVYCSTKCQIEDWETHQNVCQVQKLAES
jgi:hypothetical protein